MLEIEINLTWVLKSTRFSFSNQNATSVQHWEIDVKLTMGSDVNLTLGLTSTWFFIFNQNTTSVQRWRLTSIWRWVLTSTRFSFSTKIQRLSNVGALTSILRWVLTSTRFSFSTTKYNVCPTLEIDVNLTLGSDVNPIFIFNQNTNVCPTWRLTSIWRRVLTSTRFSFSTKIQRLSNLEIDRQSYVGFWRQPDFQFSTKIQRLSTLEIDVNLTLGSDVNPFSFSTKIQLCPTLEIDVIWRRVLTSTRFSFSTKIQRLSQRWRLTSIWRWVLTSIWRWVLTSI